MATLFLEIIDNKVEVDVIRAIKGLRTITGMGLREAKSIIDNLKNKKEITKVESVDYSRDLSLKTGTRLLYEGNVRIIIADGTHVKIEKDLFNSGIQLLDLAMNAIRHNKIKLAILLLYLYSKYFNDDK